MISPEQLDSYADQIDAAIATSSIEATNNGQLTAPYERDNRRTATFDIVCPPELSSLVQPHALFHAGEPLTISLHHAFDPRGNDDFVYSIEGNDSKPESDTNCHAEELTAAGWFHTFAEPQFLIRGSEHANFSQSDFTQLSTVLLQERVSDVSLLFDSMSVRDAITLAILRLRDTPLRESMTREVGIKTARNSSAVNGFKLKATRSIYKSATQPLYTLSSIGIQQSFRAEAYGGTWDGYLNKELAIRQQRNEPTQATKAAKIFLSNNPFSADGELIAHTDPSPSKSVPEPLLQLLYTDDTVTSEDLDYFMRLATEPLDFGKLDIQL